MGKIASLIGSSLASVGKKRLNIASGAQPLLPERSNNSCRSSPWNACSFSP
jgi:hypothetical protein